MALLCRLCMGMLEKWNSFVLRFVGIGFVHSVVSLIVLFPKKPLVRIETTTASNSILYPI